MGGGPSLLVHGESFEYWGGGERGGKKRILGEGEFSPPAISMAALDEQINQGEPARGGGGAIRRTRSIMELYVWRGGGREGVAEDASKKKKNKKKNTQNHPEAKGLSSDGGNQNDH